MRIHKLVSHTQVDSEEIDRTECGNFNLGRAKDVEYGIMNNNVRAFSRVFEVFYRFVQYRGIGLSRAIVRQ